MVQRSAEKADEKENQIAAKILKEISERLFFLDNVGLPYLSLSRKSGTLSGGESQRIRLASQIGSGLTGVLYVLDESSIGLHQRDNDRLLITLKRLRDLGNTVIVVEHDEDAIRTADYLVDMGPGAGVHGGNVVAAGTPEEVFANPKSVTGDYMTGRRFIPVPSERRKGHAAPGKKNEIKKIVLEGASGNNLHDVTAEFPLGTFTCVTGVSGSGKSSLTVDTLYAALAQRLNNERIHPSPFKKSPVWSISIKSLISTSRRLAVHHVPTLRPIPVRSRLSVTGMRVCLNQKRGGINRDVSLSTSRAVVAKPVRVMASLKSKCTSCRMCMSHAMCAKANAMPAIRWK